MVKASPHPKVRASLTTTFQISQDIHLREITKEKEKGPLILPPSSLPVSRDSDLPKVVRASLARVHGRAVLVVGPLVRVPKASRPILMVSVTGVTGMAIESEIVASSAEICKL